MQATKKAVRVRVPREAGLVRFLMRPVGKVLVASFLLVVTAAVLTFTIFYLKYSKLIDEKLKGGPFTSTSRIYAAPVTVAVGDATSPIEIADRLRRAGYDEARDNPVGTYTVHADSIEILPRAGSAGDREEGLIKFSKDHISRIISLRDNTDRSLYQLDPEMVTNLYDRNREKRRLLKYKDIPDVLRNAVLSAEDRRFFSHSGFDPIGILRSAFVDIRLALHPERGRNAQGASTLSMQLARDMWLTPDRNWRRKAAEVMITLQLEQKLSKQEIFEFYCNQVDLGRRGSFTIRGMGEAAQAYFGKDIHNLNAAEAATLAGVLRGASYYNPWRHPDRVVERRNMILGMMRQNGYLSDREYALAIETPLKLSSSGAESSDAPYFVDLVNDELQNRFQDYDFQAKSYNIYTTLDLNLQRAANDAVHSGMLLVDEQLKKQKRHKNVTFPEAQCALIALDPHTGAIKALVGGRNYGTSQLNHVLAERQPGSIFKPFVYAAAMNTAISGGPRTLTPATTVVDEPTTFWYDNKPYEPGNFENEFYGVTTLRNALAHSLNVATIKVAEMVGFNTVVNLARKAGINEDIRATPSLALGAYEATPLEMAGAYTVFANHGVYVGPTFLASLRDHNGSVIYKHRSDEKVVLDPRVDYLMVNMMEEVLRSGTGASVRSRGFKVPAAGKTGTSHDGWFAGFTSELLCIVWVGFDDNRELNLQGAHSALPIWVEFMKRALQYPGYRNAKAFNAPDGVVTIQIDPESGMPATPFCPKTRPEVFVAGTEPVGTCPLHGGNGPADTTNVSGWETPSTGIKVFNAPGSAAPTQTTPSIISSRQTPQQPAAVNAPASQPQTPPQPAKKKNFFRRLFGR